MLQWNRCIASHIRGLLYCFCWMEHVSKLPTLLLYWYHIIPANEAIYWHSSLNDLPKRTTCLKDSLYNNLRRTSITRNQKKPVLGGYLCQIKFKCHARLACNYTPQNITLPTLLQITEFIVKKIQTHFAQWYLVSIKIRWGNDFLRSDFSAWNHYKFYTWVH